ncbi:MAG: crotonase/enoyl-CoA hydratase family protein [Roseibium sp.]|uniref:crotonase/enoyl-CoA hydratase family protein n=1 Tax=Roseibium sp. TaxID=1936156 RepID=UPI001B013C4A|nr:crotonase/enoyl-CoA hydratase family protein [Roseibium sp.]MBO6506987.1 crotonase/enoyl-CoA hydratase family protein [Roseibium sp.]MBO6890770.1 crotonase/enoyl-CoA hydratase family protein [Roseibium sp.]MBO6930353.1 crotonase/enoyl-CoA hydratase family protein [Roseibium sp.]
MIRISLEDGVQTLRLDRPEKKNALTGAMYSDLAEALETGNGNPDVRCHLICGQPEIFTAGNDIGDFLQYAGRVAIDETPVVRFLRALVTNEKPLVASVDGIAIGVGTTLLMHCDMVFASPRALIRSPFVDLGLVPEAGSSLLGPQLMGHARAFELLCLGNAFSAERALQAGLVNEVVAEDVDEVALACAKAISAKPPEALALSRKLLRGDTGELSERVEEEIRIFANRLTAPETIAAFQAFMTKKPKA